MKNIRLLIIFAASGLLATSCYWQQPHTVIGTGPVESMDVNVPVFTGVTVEGQCNVTITTGTEQSVTLLAQSQVLDVMSWEVRGGVLEIGFRRGYNVNPGKDISAEIVVNEMDYISITGAGSFVASGDPQPYLSVYITGSGNVDAAGLEVEDCQVSITGAGNCRVYATRSLNVDISGVGTVFYRGNPDVDYKVSGVGNVSPLPD